MKPISYFGTNYPSDFNKPFDSFMHGQFIEHYIRTSDDLSMLGFLESVSNLVVWPIAMENGFPGSRFEFSTIVFRYESVRLASKNPPFVVI